jgi:broad specificity phosphatase PhoE
MTRLVLCRHGEPEESALGSFSALDVGLSARGRAQSEALGTALRAAAPVTLSTSPARRAFETATAIGSALDLEPLVDRDLRELEFGDAEGLHYDEVAERWPALYEAWLRRPTSVCFPGGEAFARFRTRALAALARAGRPEVAAVVVTHAGVIRTALAHWLAMPDDALFRIDQGYGCVSVVEWRDGTPLVRLLNSSPAGLAPAGRE